MTKIAPQVLQPGDTIRIIAPSRSMKILSDESVEIATKNLENLGFHVTFGKHVSEMDEFLSSSIENRLEDLHEAFADKNVKGILTVIGGFNSNQLLIGIDWSLIKNNPKVFCGFSDITALNNSLFAKTGLVNFSGPHFSTFGQKHHLEFTTEYFKKMVMSDEVVELTPSSQWFDDAWWMDQENRVPVQNIGWHVIHNGSAEGTIIGGNLCTLNLLQGTEYFPDLANSVLFLEDDELAFASDFDRNLQSLIHLPDFHKVKGIVIGRFQKVSKFEREFLEKIIETKKELADLPIIANVDFGHTDPKITFPVGGKVKMKIDQNNSVITISK